MPKGNYSKYQVALFAMIGRDLSIVRSDNNSFVASATTKITSKTKKFI